MTSKNIIRMTIVLVVLVVISLLIPKFVYRSSRRKAYQNTQSSMWKKIMVHTAQETYTLMQHHDEWNVLSSSFVYVADETAVTGLIEGVSQLEVGSIISSNKDRHDMFEVTDEKGAHVQLFAGDKEVPEVDFYLGKTAQDYMTSYLRFNGEDDVYYATGLQSYLIKKDLDRWRNRRLGARAAEDIEKIILTEGKNTQTIVLDAGTWRYNDREVAESDVQPLAKTLGSLHASALISPEEEQETAQLLTDPHAQLEIHEAGKQIILTFFTGPSAEGAQPEEYSVKKADEAGIFKIRAGTYDSINNNFDTIKTASEKLPEPEPEPEQNP